MHVALRAARTAATAPVPILTGYEYSICEPVGLRTALDYGVIFSCVPPENRASLKSTAPPVNATLVKSTVPPENLARRKSTVPAVNSARVKRTVPPENSAPAKSDYGVPLDRLEGGGFADSGGRTTTNPRDAKGSASSRTASSAQPGVPC